MADKQMDFIPEQDYVAAADAVRERTGTADPIKSGEMAGMIRGLEIIDDTIVQEKGQNTNKTMSQKAVTEFMGEIESGIENADARVDNLEKDAYVEASFEGEYESI